MSDAYSTHLPLLRHLGAHLTLRRVLECGAGRYSTALFLDRTAFPALARLDSLESDGDWLQQVRAALPDTRLHLTWTRDLMHVYVQDIDLDSYDLIFIDNGPTAAARIAVIEAVSQAHPTALTVIHDTEHTPYQQAAQGWDYQHFYTLMTPWTAALWNGRRPEMEALFETLPVA